MGRTRTPGLVQRGEIWWIEKEVRGYGRIRESTGARDLERATEVLNHKLNEVRKAKQFGVRPTRTFREAATFYLESNGHKRSLGRDAQDLRSLDPFIGDLALPQVHMGTLQPFIDARRKETVSSKGRRKKGVAAGTINRALRIARLILNLAARLWRDEFGLTWLETAPMIVELPEPNKRKPYPVSWDEQSLLLRHLPKHLRRMALYAANTGCREQEVVQLNWAWEMQVPELETSVFVIPAWLAKNGQERIVVLNRMAKHIVDVQRGRHPERVFTYKDRPVTKMYNTAWKHGRREASQRYQEVLKRPCPEGFKRVRVHDLKHTCGRRLRAGGVGLEDRQDILGHKANRITTDYSAVELRHLIGAVERIWRPNPHKSPTVLSLVVRKAA